VQGIQLFAHLCVITHCLDKEAVPLAFTQSANQQLLNPTSEKGLTLVFAGVVQDVACCGDMAQTAPKDHAAAPSPLPPLGGWGGEWKEKGKTCGSG